MRFHYTAYYWEICTVIQLGIVIMDCQIGIKKLRRMIFSKPSIQKIKFCKLIKGNFWKNLKGTELKGFAHM